MSATTTTTNLDKSLDDIISSQPRSGRRGRFSRGVKKTSAVRKAAVASTKATKQQASAGGRKGAKDSSVLPDISSLADKVILSNLPTDIDETSVRKYFSAEIGPVTKVEGGYNKNGSRNGVMTLYFKKQGDAAKAVTRFNGTSIDNGARTMKVELIVDPNKKALADRLKPAAAAAAKKAAAAKPKAAKAKKPKAPRARRPKKSLEELDADMADYFQDPATTA